MSEGEWLTRSLGKQESIWVSDVAMMTSVHMTTNTILTGTSHESPSLVNGVQPNWREERGREGFEKSREVGRKRKINVSWTSVDFVSQ